MIYCGSFEVDLDIVKSTAIIKKKLPLYKGEDTKIIIPERTLLNRIIRRFKKKEPKISKNIFCVDNWEYVTINFLILNLTKATVIYFEKLPKYSMKHTKKNIDKIINNNIKINKHNSEIEIYIEEFNAFLKYIKGKEELSVKAKDLKMKIEAKKKLKEINENFKQENVVEKVKKRYGMA